MTVELDEIDELLQRYSAAENRIASNLHELQDHAAYDLLRNGAVDGSTAAQLGPAVAAADQLWDMFSQLRDALSRARRLRGTDRRMNDRQRAPIIEILTGPSILVETVVTPLSERGLFDESSNERRITIERLLDDMRAAYEPLRDGVAAIHAVHRNLLPRLDAAEVTIAAAARSATELGIVEPEVETARRRLETVRSLMLDDPLALAPDEGERLDRQVRLAAGRVADVRRGRDRLESDLASMAGLVAEVRTLRARAATALAEATAKIAGPAHLVRVPPVAAIDGPNGLAARSKAIIDDPSPSWQQRRARLDKWLLVARRLRDQLAAAEASNRVGLQRRDELRGLLTAYRAKMAGTGKAEHRAAFEVADEAHNELYTRPTNLARAEQLLGELARTVA